MDQALCCPESSPVNSNPTSFSPYQVDELDQIPLEREKGQAHKRNRTCLLAISQFYFVVFFIKSQSEIQDHLAHLVRMTNTPKTDLAEQRICRLLGN